MLSHLQHRGVWITGILLAALIACGALWWQRHKGDYFPKNFGVVEPGRIFRSGQLSPALVKKTLASHQVKKVIDLEGAIATSPAKRAEVEACSELGVERLNFPLRGDGTGDLNRYADAIAAIVFSTKQGEPVLVHCAAGAQRTGGVIATYELLVQGKSPREVRREMLHYGWKSSDVKMLTYVNSNMTKLAAMLVDRKVIAKVPNPLPQIPTE